jgi:hypothetical protein
MAPDLPIFVRGARDLSKAPLGIIALFIVLVYGVAALVVGLSKFSGLQRDQTALLIWFLVLFPVLVLAMFGWLVSRHHIKLYHPAEIPENVRDSWSHPQQVVTPQAEPAGGKKTPRRAKRKGRELGELQVVQSEPPR